MKKIILVGGTGNLSAEIFKHLSKLNTKISVIDLPSSKLKKYNKLKNVSTFEADISNEKEFINAFNKAYKYLKKIDVLINCASLTSEFFKNSDQYFKQFHEYTLETWNKSISINLSGTFLSCREAIKFMLKQKEGKIINFSSLYGVVSPNFNLYKHENFNTPASYTATKAGIIGMTKWLAANYGKEGIAVNCISPGGILNKQKKEFINKYSSMTPLGRMGYKNNLNNLIEFIVFEKNTYINGHNFVVDGGFSIW